MNHKLLNNFITHLQHTDILTSDAAIQANQEIPCFLEDIEQEETAIDYSKFCVFLDAGHGGLNQEDKYTTFPDKCFFHNKGEFHKGGWFYEGVWNRVLTNRVAELLKELGIKYEKVYHDIEDTPLSYRAKIANTRSKLHYKHSIYISNHSNAFDGKTPNVRGFEVYTSPGSTDSDHLADIHLKNVKDLLGSKIKYRTDESDGDMDREANFYVLRKTVMPSILIEHLFFDNYEDASLLMMPDIIEAFAEAQVRTIIEYFNSLL